MTFYRLPDWKEFHDTMMNAVSTNNSENVEVEESLYVVSGLMWLQD